MVAVPMMKLFSMTVKTLAKPMSKRIKTEAQKHPTFRGVLNRMGQAANNVSTRISIRSAGHTTTKIKPLEEDKAIADGGDILAEGFIYGLGTFLMVFEYMSSAKEKEEKEAKAKIKKDQEKREMAQALEDINNRLAKLEASGERSVPGKESKGAPPGGGESRILGLSVSAMPTWRRRWQKIAGPKTDRGSMQDTRDGGSPARTEAQACAVSAAEAGSSSIVCSPSVVRSVSKAIEDSAQRTDGESVVTGGWGWGSGTASRAAQRGPRRSLR